MTHRHGDHSGELRSFPNAKIYVGAEEMQTEDDACELRAEYDGIRPAWHMNKKYWSDVYFHEDVPDDVIRDLVKQSYDLVSHSLPKTEREQYQ